MHIHTYIDFSVYYITSCYLIVLCYTTLNVMISYCIKLLYIVLHHIISYPTLRYCKIWFSWFMKLYYIALVCVNVNVVLHLMLHLVFHSEICLISYIGGYVYWFGLQIEIYDLIVLYIKYRLIWYFNHCYHICCMCEILYMVIISYIDMVYNTIY